MRDSIEAIDIFLNALRKHAIQKSVMYDSHNADIDIHTAIVYAAEELGEISTACVRNRWLLAFYECLDLAHCAMLIQLAIQRNHLEAQNEH